MAKIVYSQAAREDLGNLWEWIALHDSEQRADTVIDRIFQRW